MTVQAGKNTAPDISQQLKIKQAADQYEGMIRAGLERVQKWAFPDSQIEHTDTDTWMLSHRKEDGTQHIDMTVRLIFLGGQLNCLRCQRYASGFARELHTQDIPLIREGLDDALRHLATS